MDDLDDFQDRLGAWGDKTFPESDEASVLAHLQHEANKELHVGCDPEELADVGILVLQLAHKRGLKLSELMTAKFAKNKLRRWGPKNDAGFWEHVKDEVSTP